MISCFGRPGLASEILKPHAMITPYVSQVPDSLKELIWNSRTDEEHYYLSIEYKAWYLGIDEEEYELFARVVEAESDRCNDDIQGRVMIAATIINRVNDSRFPDTISGVLTQSGQFTTVSCGRCSTQSTLLSEWAIIEAYYQIADGLIPENVLFFNCIGYNNGTPYGEFGGNYFMQA